MTGRSILIYAGVIILGVFAVVGIWYFFAVGFPEYYQQGAINSAPSAASTTQPSSTHQSSVTQISPSGASSTATTTFFGGTIKVATDTPDPLTLFLYPNSLASGISVIGVVESSAMPVTNALIDSRYTSGLSNDSYFKVALLAQLWPSGQPQASSSGGSIERVLDSQEVDVVTGNTYVNPSVLVPGNVVMLQIAACQLYSGWPNFACTNTMTLPPQQWTVAPNNLFVSWQGQNGASLSLTGASLNTFASTSVLALQMNATSGYGEFCPSSLSVGGPALVRNENGSSLSPAAAFPSGCIGPNATSMASIFFSFPVATSTFLTINIPEQSNSSSQTFFELYPLPDGQLFLVNASTSDAAGQ